MRRFQNVSSEIGNINKIIDGIRHVFLLKTVFNTVEYFPEKTVCS